MRVLPSAHDRRLPEQRGTRTVRYAGHNRAVLHRPARSRKTLSTRSGLYTDNDSPHRHNRLEQDMQIIRDMVNFSTDGTVFGGVLRVYPFPAEATNATAVLEG